VLAVPKVVSGEGKLRNSSTDFFGDQHCNSRITNMLCDAQAQYGDYSELDECPMWGMWEKEGGVR
jgi:hypothetical protein